MKKLLGNIWNFYIEGFRSMTLGKTLWTLILIKLFIMFCILRLFFFPNYINSHAESKEDKNAFVGNELINRSLGDKN